LCIEKFILTEHSGRLAETSAEGFIIPYLITFIFGNYRAGRIYSPKAEPFLVDAFFARTYWSFT
jgi:hypothetical protein